MELILTDDNKTDIGPFGGDVDFEIGDDSMSNNFEIISEKLKDGYCLYSQGTEWGGIVEYSESATNKQEMIFRGHTWRGLLMQDIIEPLPDQDYRIVSGEANAVIRDLLSDVLGGFFCVPEVESGLTITSYQFPLRCKVGTGIMDMLAGYGYRLKIYAEKPTAGGEFVVYAEAVERVKIEGEYDTDSKVPMRFIHDRMGINHLVCMGKGDLKERQRVDLYVQEDGSIGKTKYYTGFQERTAYYDYSSVESLEELEKGGIKRLNELKKGKRLQIDLPDQDYEVGDVVSGRNREQGIAIEKTIAGKILRRQGGRESIEYKVKGD